MSKANKQIDTFTARKTMLENHRLGEKVKGADASRDMVAVMGKAKGSSVFEFTAAVNSAIDAWGIDTTQIFATDRNPKVIKRFIQFVHAVNAKNYKSIDCVSATILYALKETGGMPLTTDALHYLAAGLKAGKLSPNTRGVNRSVMGRIFDRVGVSTVPTQASRSVGKNGFLQLSGATKGEPGKVNQNVTLNESHPLVVAFFDCMNAATEGQISEMVGE